MVNVQCRNKHRREKQRDKQREKGIEALEVSARHGYLDLFFNFPLPLPCAVIYSYYYFHISLSLFSLPNLYSHPSLLLFSMKNFSHRNTLKEDLLQAVYKVDVFRGLIESRDSFFN